MRWSTSELKLSRIDRRPLLLPSVASDPATGVEEDADPDPEPASVEDLWDQAAEDEEDQSSGDRLFLAIPGGVARAFRSELCTVHLKRIAAVFGRLQKAWARGEATWDMQADLERRIYESVDVIAWLGENIAQEIADRFVASVRAKAGADEAFAPALALLSFDGTDCADLVLGQLPLAEPVTADGIAQAIRLASHPELTRRLPALVQSVLTGALRAALIPALVDRSLFDEQLAATLLASDSTEVVAEAARGVLLTGASRLVPELERQAFASGRKAAQAELLTSAAILGSRRALEEIRRSVAAGEQAWPRLVTALAVCGDERDLPVLIGLAEAGRIDALRALGWLGSDQVSAALDALADAFDPAAVAGLTGEESANEERAVHGAARAALLRIEGKPELSANGPRPGRWLEGHPWSAQSVATLLAAPSTRSADRELAFLDLCGRTGLHVPFDVAWPVARQERAAAEWGRTVSGSKAHFDACWYHRGRNTNIRR